MSLDDAGMLLVELVEAAQTLQCSSIWHEYYAALLPQITACEISDDEYSDDEEAAYLHVFAKEVI